VKRDAELLARLAERLYEGTVRVTATDPGDAYERHVVDALTAAELVDAAPPGALVDVGAGGGIPGLPLAIRFPQRPVTLLEATARKAAFLTETIAVLGLPNVTVVADRAEVHAAGPGRDAFAVATARALAPPAVALELCLPLVRAGGILVLYAGAVAAAELDPVADALGARVERELLVAGSDRRRLVVVRKLAPTPARFPRRVGMAAKRPLRFT